MRVAPAAFVLASFALAAPTAAQDAPPRIGPIVVDMHGTVPKFTDEAQLATSRGLLARELPGIGFGLHAGAHVYVFKWKAVTVGLGGDLTRAGSHSSAKPLSTDETARAVTERFTHIAPQLSFNFGSGDGWSYVSGGIGPSRWSIVADGAPPAPADQERLKTIDYGGGARWFIKPHLAFSFDVRFYAIDPGSPNGSLGGSPRTTLLIMGAGVSLK